MSYIGDIIDFSTPPESIFSPLPAGWYTATIVDAELKDTKSDGGKYIKIKYSITGPTHQGRLVFENINIKNQSQVAEGIGRSHLYALKNAIGLNDIKNTDELINGQVQILVEIKKSQGFSDQNEVKEFKPVSNFASSHVATSQPDSAIQATAISPPEKATPPWAMK